jgi:predicted Fe-Mo cluster-binding NifX family protein
MTERSGVKIAVVTDDSESISRHFGRAGSYLVVTVEDDKVIAQELRPKAGHDDFAGQGDGSHEPGQPRGYGRSAAAKHAAMIDSIRDCEVVIAGGMGRGAFESLRKADIATVITDERNVALAIERFVRGDLPNLDDRLH